MFRLRPNSLSLLLALLVMLFSITSCKDLSHENKVKKSIETFFSSNRLDVDTDQARELIPDYMNDQERGNLSVIGNLVKAIEEFREGEIEESQFNIELAKYLAKDVSFETDYVPSHEKMKPVFQNRKGITEVVERIKLLNEVERVKQGSDFPYDLAINRDILYFSQLMEARYYKGKYVQYYVLNKVKFSDGLISKIEQFIGFAPLEEQYGKATKVPRSISSKKNGNKTDKKSTKK